MKNEKIKEIMERVDSHHDFWLNPTALLEKWAEFGMEIAIAYKEEKKSAETK